MIVLVYDYRLTKLSLLTFTVVHAVKMCNEQYKQMSDSLCSYELSPNLVSVTTACNVSANISISKCTLGSFTNM